MTAMNIVKGPIGYIIGLIAWLVVFSLFIGAINGWYLNLQATGTFQSERFDRIVFFDANNVQNETVDDRWGKVTAVVNNQTADVASGAATSTNAYKINLVTGGTAGTANTCKVGASVSDTAFVDAYTPRGTKIKVGASDGLITGCKWELASDVLLAGGLSGLVEIILQAAGLAPPIGLLYVVGTFGSAFIRNLSGNPIMVAVLTAILLLIVASLLEYFLPFLSDAFNSIDGNRFVMYDEGLGSLSTVVSNFLGVTLVAGMMMIAWHAFQRMRGGQTLGGDGGGGGGSMGM